LCLNAANSSADFTHNHTSSAIQIIGKIKIKLYTIKYINHQVLTELLSDAKYPSIVIYGPDVHGNKNRLTKNQTINAQIGDVAFLITLCNLGLRASGTSIRNHSQYQKKSFIFASHTIIPSIHTIHFIITVFVAVANAENNPNHIAKYDRNTANANRSPAKIAFFLSFVSISIEERSSKITAKAHGFILSANAAGIMTPKNDR
jgi:hypothetical protein